MLEIGELRAKCEPSNDRPGFFLGEAGLPTHARGNTGSVGGKTRRLNTGQASEESRGESMPRSDLQ
jgi:hypothetical protein